MAILCCSSCRGLVFSPKSLLPCPLAGGRGRGKGGVTTSRSFWKGSALVAKASMVDSSESSSSFAKRAELAWLISQQPIPIACSSCNSKGYVECNWCGGTGFFILGDNMLCEVPSRNTKCVICAGKGSACCADCKGTGFRAKWLDNPPPH
ncbi:uncharacterized protein [Typha latifolia]|uniref:uncharacterized protein n=1 Tax=Typha latifolia TaxID=4733 RepID=UPI003C2DE5AF